MSVALVNGRAYDFTQITVTFLDVALTGVSAISYSEEQDKVNNFAGGNRPNTRGHGPIDASGSIEMSMNEVEAIRDAAPDGSLLNIESFDITVVFGNPQDPQTHVLKNCEFLNDGVDASQGDTDLRRSFDLVISHIKYR